MNRTHHKTMHLNIKLHHRNKNNKFNRKTIKNLCLISKCFQN